MRILVLEIKKLKKLNRAAFTTKNLTKKKEKYEHASKSLSKYQEFFTCELDTKIEVHSFKRSYFCCYTNKGNLYEQQKNFPSLLNDYHINLKSYNLTKTLHTNFPVINKKNKSKIEEDLFMIKIREDSGTIIIDSTIK